MEKIKQFRLITVLIVFLGIDKEFASISEEITLSQRVVNFIIGGPGYLSPWIMYAFIRPLAIEMFLENLKGYESIPIMDQEKKKFLEFSELLKPLLKTTLDKRLGLRIPRRGKENIYDYLFKVVEIKKRFPGLHMKQFRRMCVEIPTLPSTEEFEKKYDMAINKFNSKKKPFKRPGIYLTRKGPEYVENYKPIIIK